MDRHAGEDDEVYDDDDSDDEEGYEDEDDVEYEDDYDDEDGCDSEDEDGSDSEEDEWLRDEEIMEIVKNWSDSATEPENNEVVLLEEGLWGRLSEEIVSGILTCLPSRAQARFHCVCLRWNALLSSSSPSIELEHSGRGKPRPSCLIKWSCDCDPLIFCHAEHKWFGVPFPVSSSLDLSWTLVDTDAGLLCYTYKTAGKTWLRVCNPMTHSYHVLPCVSTSSLAMDDPVTLWAVIVVDRATKSFKVILLPCTDSPHGPPRFPHSLVVFDSRTNCWTYFPYVSSERYEIGSLFLRKKVMYFTTSHSSPNVLETFHVDSGEWSQVNIEYPCNYWRGSFIKIISNKDRVMLVYTNPKAEEPTRVWRHLDNLSDNSIPIFTAPRCEQVMVVTHPLMRSLFKYYDHCLSDGSEYLCFIFSRLNRWVKYTFATRRWDVMPHGGLPEEHYELWFVWEPCLDMVLRSRGTFDYSDHPQLEHDHRSVNESHQNDLSGESEDISD